MKRYVIRRLLMAIPLLLAISFVCFCFINLIPSNPAEVALRVQQTPVITDEIIAAMEEQLGLNKPFFVRYFDWVLGCLHGDFGISYPVIQTYVLLIGVLFVLFNLLFDILQTVSDPRLRKED